MNVSEVQKHAIHKKILCWKISAKNFFLISSDIDDCYPSPCKNNGTCIDGVNNYTCSCVPGFEGKNCTISKLLNDFNNLVFFSSYQSGTVNIVFIALLLVFLFFVFFLFFFFHWSVNAGVFKVKLKTFKVQRSNCCYCSSFRKVMTVIP